MAAALGRHHAFVWVSGRNWRSIYTTNIVEPLHMTLGKVIKTRFVSERRGGIETALPGAEQCAEAVARDPGLEACPKPFHVALG